MSRLRHVAKRTLGVASAFTLPPRVPLGHYYSPATKRADAERAIRWAAKTDTPAGIECDLAAWQALSDELAPMWGDIDTTGARYRRNEMYELVDAAIYHSILRRFNPKRVIEIGSGYSTAVALDTIEAHGLQTSVQCVEPNTGRLKALLRPGDDVKLRKQFVQDVPLDFFDQLEAGDILFIDSTHVAKAGSDVVWTTLRVLPRLKPGVIVHIHDMFWPLEYRPEWLLERRDWTEIYLIHAFLSGNPGWSILFFNDQAILTQPDVAQKYFSGVHVDHRPGGLWLRRGVAH